ncbi:unnamed protein product [Didymodactylos carnosus]|uniref:Uncharacterized protein n=1 Tax=Didymodactylos carnosus TaxID=1234261 RepID=A0A815NR17_9BILA|nr:unnamed protein product [Didymodactylos carnosus]CAF4314171.1 unnamed protein product [Didymodactylos carnosus]
MAQIMMSYLFKTNLSAFRSAILKDDTDKICRILDVERDHLFKDVDSTGNSGLLLAVMYSSPITVRLLLSQGAHPDKANSITYETPLSYLAQLKCEPNSAEEKRAYEIAQSLIEAGAYVDKPTFDNYMDEKGSIYLGKETPLMIAVKKQNLTIAKLLCESGANINYAERKSKIRPIHIAVTNGDEKMFDLFDNCGAQMKDVLTEGDNTLLHWFCYIKSNESLYILKRLLELGCDINAENHHQRTPLMLGARNGLVETVRLLLNKGAKTDKIDFKGYRALDFAKVFNQMACYHLLKDVTDPLPTVSSEASAQGPSAMRRRLGPTLSNQVRLQRDNSLVWRKKLQSNEQRRATIDNHPSPAHSTQSDDMSVVGNNRTIDDERNNVDLHQSVGNINTDSSFNSYNQKIDQGYDKVWEVNAPTTKKDEDVLKNIIRSSQRKLIMKLDKRTKSLYMT